MGRKTRLKWVEQQLAWDLGVNKHEIKSISIKGLSVRGEKNFYDYRTPY